MKKTNGIKPGISRTRLAAKSGVGVETIRYYERRGLIDAPIKTGDHSHPVYSRRTLEQLIFVKRAKNAGFTLKEIVTLLSLGSEHCSVTKSLAQEKLEKIQHQITELHRKVELLQVLIKQCGTHDNQGKCGFFETLQDKDEPSDNE